MKKSHTNELPDFDASKYLNNKDAIAEYLTAIIGENDPFLLTASLGDIARSRGISEISKSLGITREALYMYKALRPNAQPRFETISRVCEALGVRLIVKPLHSNDHPEKRIPA